MKLGSLQAEFVPSAALRGRFAASVVATEGDHREVESLSPSFHSPALAPGASVGDAPRRGRMAESTRQALC